MEEENNGLDLNALMQRKQSGEKLIKVGPERLVKGDLPFQPLNKYDRNLLRNSDQGAVRAGNQSNAKAWGNAAVQAVSELGLGTLEGAGYLLDFEAIGKSFMGTEREFGNWFSDIMKVGKEHVSQEVAPIYGGDGFEPLSAKFWAKNFPSIVSSLSLMVPAAGVTRLASAGAKMAGRANIARKASGKSFSEIRQIIEKGNAITNASSGAKLAAKGFTGAMTSRIMENTMEASETAKSTYEKLISQGMEEEAAKEEAGRQASNVWRANLVNLIPDTFQYAIMYGAADDMLKAIAKTTKQKLGDVAKTMGSEAIEEGLQFGIQQNAKSEGVMSTLINAVGNVGDYLDDDEFKTAVLMGAVGGGVFSTIGHMADKTGQSAAQRSIIRAREYLEGLAKDNKYVQEKVKREVVLENTPEQNANLKEFAEEGERANIENIEATKEQATNVVEHNNEKNGVQPTPEIKNEQIQTEAAIVLNAKQTNEIVEETTQMEAEMAVTTATSMTAETEPVIDNTPLAEKILAEKVNELPATGGLDMAAIKSKAEKITKKDTPAPTKEEKEHPGYPALEHKVETQLLPAKLEAETLKEKKEQLKDPEAYEAKQKKQEIANKLQKLEETDNIEEIKTATKDPDTAKKATDKLEERISEVFNSLEGAKYNSMEELEKAAPEIKAFKDVNLASTGESVYDALAKEFVEEVETGGLNIAAIKANAEKVTPKEEVTIENSPFSKPHIPVVTPSEPVLTNVKEKIELEGEQDLDLWHPMRGVGMDMKLDHTYAKNADGTVKKDANGKKVIKTRWNRIVGDNDLKNEWLNLFNIDVSLVRDVIRHFHKYADSPIYVITRGDIEWNKGDNRERNFQMLYAVKVDGKFVPFEMAKDLNKIAQNIHQNGKIVNPALREGYLLQEKMRKELFALMKANPNETVHLPYTLTVDNYMKGRHNNGDQVRTVAELAGDTPFKLGLFEGKGRLFDKVAETIPEYSQSKAKNISDKKDGLIYMLFKDTMGFFRWNRVFTKSIHEVPEVMEEINNLLMKVQDASQFLKDNGISRNQLWYKEKGKLSPKKILDLKEKIKANPENYKGAERFLDYIDNYKIYAQELNEIVRFKDDKGQVQPSIGLYTFISPVRDHYTGKDNSGVWSVRAYAASVGMITRTDKGITSKPIQLSIKKLNRGDYNKKVAKYLVTNLNNINDHLVSPSFYMGTKVTPTKPFESKAALATKKLSNIELNTLYEERKTHVGITDIVNGYTGGKQRFPINATGFEVAENLKAGNITLEDAKKYLPTVGGKLEAWFERGIAYLESTQQTSDVEDVNYEEIANKIFTYDFNINEQGYPIRAMEELVADLKSGKLTIDNDTIKLILEDERVFSEKGRDKLAKDKVYKVYDIDGNSHTIEKQRTFTGALALRPAVTAGYYLYDGKSKDRSRGEVPDLYFINPKTFTPKSEVKSKRQFQNKVYIKAYDELRNAPKSKLEEIRAASLKALESGGQSSPISVARSYMASKILDGETKQLDAKYAKPTQVQETSVASIIKTNRADGKVGYDVMHIEDGLLSDGQGSLTKKEAQNIADKANKPKPEVTPDTKNLEITSKLANLKIGGKKNIRFQKGSKGEKEAIKAFTKWAKDKLGIDVAIVDGLINIGGVEAFGVTYDAVIELSKLAEKGTGFHEAFHLVFNNVFSPSERARMIAESGIKPTDTQIASAQATIDSLNENYENIDMDARSLAIEEILADRFRDYQLGISEKGFIGRMFKRLAEFIKGIIGNKSEIERLFEGISTGKFKNSITPKVTSPRFKETGEFSSEQKADIVNIFMQMLDRLVDIKNKDNLDTIYKGAFNTDATKNTLVSLDAEDSALRQFLAELEEKEGFDWREDQMTLRIIEGVRPDLIHGGEPRLGILVPTIQQGLRTRGVTITTKLTDDTAGLSGQISEKSVSVTTGFTNTIKRFLANQYTDREDIFGYGISIALDPGEAYAMLQTEIGNSIDVNDMFEAIKNSKFPWINNLTTIIPHKDSEIVTQLFTQVGQKVHPQFKTILEEDGTVIESNRATRANVIYNELYDKINGLNLIGFSNKLNRYIRTHNKTGIKEVLDYLFPTAVVSAIQKSERSADILSALASAADKMQKGTTFKGAFYSVVNKLQNYYPSNYQSAHLNVEGEKVYEWMNSNFIGRQLNMFAKRKEETMAFYESDPLYANLPLFKQLRANTNELALGYVDGVKYKGKTKGVQPSNFSPSDSLYTMLMLFHNSGLESMYTSMPIMGDSKVNVVVKMKKAENAKIVKEHIVDLIELEYKRAMADKEFDSKFKTYSTAKEGEVPNSDKMVMFETIVGENMKGWDRVAVRNKVNEYINAKTTLLTHKAKELRVDLEQFVKDGRTDIFLQEFISNHIAASSQLMLLTTGDFAFYKNAEDYYKRAKEIHSPGIFLNMEATYGDETIPSTIRARIRTDIEIRSPQADEIETISGKGTYDKSSLTDAQTYIDPMSYKWRMIGLGRWNDTFNEQFEVLMNGGIPEGKTAFQTLKAFFYNLEKYEGKIIPTQKKDSEFLVIPLYGRKTINGIANPLYNPEYKSMLEDMGYTFTDKGVSFDASNRKIDLVTFDTTMKVGRLQDGIAHLSMDSWRLQMETPEHHMDTDGLFGTQIMKLITANVADKSLINEYNELINEDIKRSYAEVAGKFENEDQLREMLKDEVINRGLGEDYLKALDDKEFPLWHPSHYHRVSSILNSLFKKKVTKRKFYSGGSYINTTAWGFERQPKIVWNKKGDPKSGIAHLEAYAPIHNKRLRQYVNSEGFIDEAGMKLIRESEDAKLLEGIAYRIPTEDKYSMLPIKIIGFMPIDNGNIVLPHEVTTIAGLDFDIDKVFSFFYASNPYTEIISQLEEAALKTESAAGEFLDTIIADTKAIMTNMGKTEQEINEVINEFNSGGASDFLSDRRRDKYNKLLKLSAEADVQIASDNRKLEIMLEVLQSPDTVKAILTPQGFDKIKETNKVIIEAQEIESATDVIDPWTLVSVKDDMNNGKQILGIYANGNAIHSILQQFNIQLRKAVKFDKEYDLFGQVLNSAGESISNIIGMRIGMAADNGKDPQASYYNANKYTADVEVMLLQLGIPSDTVQYFLAQPGIKYFVNNYFNAGGTAQAEQDLLNDLNIGDLKGHTLEGVTEAQLIEGLKGKSEAFNMRMLKDFLVYKQQAKGVMKFQRAIKNADAGAGVTGANNYVKRRAYSNSAKKEYAKLMSGTDEAMESNNILNTFMEYGIIKADDTIADKAGMIKLTNGYGSNFDELVSTLENDKGSNLTEDEVIGLVNGYINYSMSEFYPMDTTVINNTLKQLAAFKKENNDHPLTSRLLIVEANEKPYIEFAGSTGMDEHEVNRVKRSWAKLSETNPELSENLIKYSIYQSGMSQGFKGFSHLQPFEFHQEQLKKVKEGLKTSFGNLIAGDVQEMRRFQYQYIRNNFQKLSFVKSLSDANILELQISTAEAASNVESARKRLEELKTIKGTAYIADADARTTFAKYKGQLYYHIGEGSYEIIPPLGKKTGKITRFIEYSKGDIGIPSKFLKSEPSPILAQIQTLEGKVDDSIAKGDTKKNCNDGM